MKSEKLLIAGGFVVICSIWGSTWLGIKIGLDSIPPFFGVAIRFSVALVILAVIVAVRKLRIPLDRASVGVYLTLGFLSFSFPYALVYWGEQYVSSGLASILFTTYPFLVAGFSHLILPDERLTLAKVGGIVLGFAGVAVIFWSDIGSGPSSTLGMAAILVSSALQALSLVIVKKRGHHLDAIPMNFGGMAIGVVIMYLIAFSLEHASAIRFDEKGIGSILYLGSFGSVATFVTYYWLLKRVEAVFLSLSAFITPIISVLLGALVLDEALSPHVFAGAVLVLAGILVANSTEVAMRIKRSASSVLNGEEL